MTHIRLIGLIAITLSIAILASGQNSGYKQDLNGNSGGQGQTAGQSQTTPQNPVNPGISDPVKSGPDPGKQAGWQDEHDRDHDKGYGGGTGSGTTDGGTHKYRTSATEIGSLGLIGASLLLASLYLMRRRSKARV